MWRSSGVLLSTLLPISRGQEIGPVAWIRSPTSVNHYFIYLFKKYKLNVITLCDHHLTDLYNTLLLSSSVKFGLYEVDFSDPERKRTPRTSAHYYRSIIKSHSLDVPTTRNEL